MAFMGAEIIRLVTRRILQARATLGKGIMGRVWTALLLALVTLVTFRSFIPVFTFVRQEVVPHLRDSTLTVFNTQPLLFLLLNSMIFAVLAPSGLFNDKSSSASSSSSYASQFSDESPAPAPDSDESPRTGQEDPDPPPVVKPEAETESETAAEAPVVVSSSASSSKRERRMRSRDGSPPKARVKRKRSTAPKCQSVKQQITLGIVESGELAGSEMESETSRPDSLKDEDFKEFIDSFIARAHHDMLRQEREYALSSRTI